MRSFEAFSVAVEECIDIINTSQLVTLIRSNDDGINMTNMDGISIGYAAYIGNNDR